MSLKRFGTTRRRFLAGSTALAGAGLFASGVLRPFGPALAAGQAHLRLLETTDIHVHVLPYDYYRDREDHTVGLAKIATLVARARAEAANSLLLDNGDFVQGNPMGDYVAYERGLREGDLHPVMAAMNAAGRQYHQIDYVPCYRSEAGTGNAMCFAYWE